MDFKNILGKLSELSDGSSKEDGLLMEGRRLQDRMVSEEQKLVTKGAKAFHPIKDTERVVEKATYKGVPIIVTFDQRLAGMYPAFNLYINFDHHDEYEDLEDAIRDAKYEIDHDIDFRDEPDTDPDQMRLFKESKPVNESLKDIFNRLSEELLGENQIKMEPAQQNTQVIKKNDAVIGTVSNPALASQLKRGIESGEVSLDQEMNEDAGHSILDVISPEELQELKGYVSGDLDPSDFYGSEVFDKLYNYYLESGELPVSIAKARTGDPDQWILDRVEQDYGSELSEGERPHHDSDFGAGLGAGRSEIALEGRTKKDNKAEKAGKKVTKDIEYDEKNKDKIHGKKRHAEDEKAEKAGKKVAKDIEYDEKKKSKKKMNESMEECIKAAELEGKAHGLKGHAHIGDSFDSPEKAKAYHQGYKDGLDERYGMRDEAPAATVPGMASQSMDLIGNDDMRSQSMDLVDYSDDADFGAWEKELNEILENDKDEDSYEAKIDKIMARLERDSRKTINPDFINDLQGAAAEEIRAVELERDSRNKHGSLKESEGDFEVGDLVRIVGNSWDSLEDELEEYQSRKYQGKVGRVKFPKARKGRRRGVSVEFGWNSILANPEDLELVKKADDKDSLEEGLSVSISKGQQGSPDSVSVTAQDNEAEELLQLVKHLSGGLFGDSKEEASDYGAPKADHGVNDHDQMMSLMKAVSVDEPKSPCYEEESEDQMEFKVAEDNQPDTGAKDSIADEDAEAEEDQALAGAMSGNEEEIDEDSHYDEDADLMEFLNSLEENDDYKVDEDDTLEEEEQMDETNAFITARRDAIKKDHDKFEVDGKHYPVKGADDKEAEGIDEGMMDRIRGLNYDRLSKRSGEKAIDAMMKAADFDFSDLDNREEHEDEFMSQMAKRQEREDRANKLLKREPADDDDLFLDEEHLNEWANDAGRNGTDEAFQQDIDFMTKVISGGLNKQKKDQTTLPYTKVKVEGESSEDWMKLAGIKK